PRGVAARPLVHLALVSALRESTRYSQYSGVKLQSTYWHVAFFGLDPFPPNSRHCVPVAVWHQPQPNWLEHSSHDVLCPAQKPGHAPEVSAKLSPLQLESAEPSPRSFSQRLLVKHQPQPSCCVQLTQSLADAQAGPTTMRSGVIW